MFYCDFIAIFKSFPTFRVDDSCKLAAGYWLLNTDNRQGERATTRNQPTPHNRNRMGDNPQPPTYPATPLRRIEPNIFVEPFRLRLCPYGEYPVLPIFCSSGAFNRGQKKFLIQERMIAKMSIPSIVFNIFSVHSHDIIFCLLIFFLSPPHIFLYSPFLPLRLPSSDLFCFLPNPQPTTHIR